MIQIVSIIHKYTLINLFMIGSHVLEAQIVTLPLEQSNVKLLKQSTIIGEN